VTAVVGNAALEHGILGAPEEQSRRARLTRWFRRAARPPSKVRRETRTAYFHEWETSCSLADLPDGTARAVKRHAEALAPTALPVRLLDQYVGATLVVATVAGIVVGLAATNAWLAGPDGTGEWMQAVLLWLPLAAIACASSLAPFADRVDRFLGQRSKFAFAAGIGCIWAFAIVALDRWGAPFGLGGIVRYAVSAAVLTAATLTATVLLLIVVYVTLAYVLRRVAIRRHADSVFIQALVDVLTNFFFLDGRDHEGLGFDPRREAVRSLETAALTADRYLPPFFDPRDETTATWLRERSAQWASALRAHKRWVITERARNEDAIERLRDTLRAAAHGEWNTVERRPAQQASRSSRLRLLVATTLRGATPLVAVVLLRVFGVPGFDGNVGDYLLAASGAWFALSFLAQYDPLFSAKIGAAADISKTLRG
jgi:hypothetical protein